MTTHPPPIEFRVDLDLIGAKAGVYREEGGQRIVLVSQAIHDLLADHDTKAKTIEGLNVVMDDGSLVWVMDILSRQ